MASDMSFLLAGVVLNDRGTRIDREATRKRLAKLLAKFGGDLREFLVNDSALANAIEGVLVPEYEHLRAVRYLSGEGIARMVSEKHPEFPKDQVLAFIEKNITKSISSRSMFYGNLRRGMVCFRRYIDRLSTSEKAKVA
jgi:hypothetical protein